MRRWLYALLDWFTAARRQYRRERHFRRLRQREVVFGAGMESPNDRQRQIISQERTRFTQ